MNKNSKYRSAFTLIELLVVISIIGMLSSVVLASLSSAREKGRIGAALKFATYNHRAIGADVKLLYNFNDPSNLFVDTSGNSFNATTPCSTCSTVSSPSGSGYALSMPSGTSFVIPAINTSGVTLTNQPITVSLWINPSSLPSAFATNFIAAGPQSAFSMNFTNTQIRIAGNNSGVIYNKALPLGVWSNVTYTIDSTKIITAYVDGVQLGSPILLGSNAGNILSQTHSVSNNLGGTTNIDEYTIYYSALTSAQVQQLYAGELTRRNLASIK